MAVGPWTSVVSYHTDPATCGVARFSRQLADRLGVPHVAFNNNPAWGDNPLLSVKFSEHCPYAQHAHYDQLWHDAPFAVYQPRTNHVWKLYELGVPALVEPVSLSDHAIFFTFGMAHKLELEAFARLRRKFQSWQLWISTADHEGAGPTKVPELMQLWGPGARNLGHLSDAALQLVWHRATACAAFFSGGLRANNSSVHAALDAHVPVVTNWGPDTPDDLKACTYNLDDLTLLGPWDAVFRRPPFAGSAYTWDRLMKELTHGPQA